MVLSEKGKELRKILENIYNNRDFVIGVMSNAPEEKWQKIIEYINYEKQHGIKTKPDDIILLSVVLSNETN